MTLRYRIASANCAAAMLLAAMLAALPLTASADAPAVKPDTKSAPKRVLFVGNSYLNFNDGLQNHVRQLASAADPKNAGQIRYRSATISGGALQDHPIEAYLAPGRLHLEGGFEMVVLQGDSAAANGDKRKAAFQETVAAFDKEIRKRNARTALYMTHAYVKPHKEVRPDMMRDLEALYVATGNRIGALVIPVGLAFEEAYKQRPSLKLQKPFDGSHPDLPGTYLAACVVYASLYGRSPVGNPYDYFGNIDKKTAAFLQQVAETTVNRFFGVTLPKVASAR